MRESVVFTIVAGVLVMVLLVVGLIVGTVLVNVIATPAVITRSAPPDASTMQLVEVAAGFDFPVYATHAGDGSGRMYVVGRHGQVWIVNADGSRQDDTFLDIRDLLYESTFVDDSDYGLQSIAFHPNYAENGYVFVLYEGTDRGGLRTSRLERFTAEGDGINRESQTVVMTAQQPFGNNNANQLLFGEDGYLYIGVGDGGQEDVDDPFNTAQRTDSLFGSVLRVDVDELDTTRDPAYNIPADNPFRGTPGTGAEIWLYGLSDPYRFSFDSATGDLYIGERTQENWEEINYQPAGEPGGANFGWAYYDGFEVYERDDDLEFVAPVTQPDNATMPLVVYGHENDERCGVTGGVVYRGDAIPDLQGVYLYGDLCSGEVWSLWRDEDLQWQSSLLLDTSYQIAAIVEDENHEVYVVDYTGNLIKFRPE